MAHTSRYKSHLLYHRTPSVSDHHTLRGMLAQKDMKTAENSIETPSSQREIGGGGGERIKVI